MRRLETTARFHALIANSQSAEGANALMGDESVPLSSRDEADRLDGVNGVGASERQPSIEDKLRATANVIPGHVWYATPSGALIFVNSRSADYLGLPKDHPLRFGIDLGGEWDSHIPLLHPDDHDETRRVWFNCLRTGSAGEVAFRVRNMEGEYHWFLSRAEPLRASDGTLVLWIGVNLDIDEAKRAEVELRRSKAHLADAQRLSHTGSAGMEAGTKRMFWSEESARIYGYSPDTEPTPDLILQRVHPDDVDLLKNVLERAGQGGSDFDFEHRLLMPDGSTKYIRSLAHPLRDGDGNEVSIGAIMDITERRLAEQRFQQKEAELRQVLDLTPQLIAVFGPRRERLYLNRVSLDFLGLTIDEWHRGILPGTQVHSDDMERLGSQWAQALSSGSAFEIEVRFRRNDGIYRWFLIRCNPVRDEQGMVLRWYAACTDIDDRKRAEDNLQQENAVLREELNQASKFEEIVGSAEPLQKVLTQISKVAPSDSTVLILGQTGTGKELIARAIHKRSKRAGRSFIGVNCGAIPTSLIASELFGHEKGAFTGATQRRLGRFEAANGGTIFLDEVGDLPHDIQIALLRVLQEREIERVGSDRPIPVDVRVLAASHRDLNKLVSEGKFREDLLYRLNVVPVTMPSLRERVSDIPILAEYFIARFGKKMGKKFRTIEKKTLKAMQEYEWPGNVRELQNVIERAVILSDSDTFAVDEAWLNREPSEVSHSSAALSGVLLAHEKEVIEAALAKCHGKISGPAGAAMKLGIPDSTLDTKIKRLGIDKYRFKPHIG
ncbi:MAG: sigma 54-interacting transcriptional regulator [Terracidiphilus sp.]|jgi:formate hydrogenlyase transcriptional activator